ncbi:DUF488 domain-containing protein [Planctomicrobium sp. SH527]|uniref:DUF488 domain-containing protein n=1 Tax=Planctomicrobium sp. SH527 TaxID=3448123 RepID=UPI003F5AF101
MATELFTIGHSNHPLDKFLDLLKEHEIAALTDIRRFPSSRKFPQFNQEELSKVLQQSGIKYHWLDALGGRRPKQKSIPPSLNSGLRNESFHNYADYMQTEPFQQGIDELLTISEQKRIAYMCSESLFWQCHRRLVSDFLTAHGHSIQHIFPSGEVKRHQMTTEARVQDKNVIYPGPKMLFE